MYLEVIAVLQWSWWRHSGVCLNSLCFIKVNVLAPSSAYTINYRHVYILVLFQVFCEYLVTAMHVESLAPCVWEWRRNTIQYSPAATINNGHDSWKFKSAFFTFISNFAQLVQEIKDEDWNMKSICESLSRKRPGEKYVVYAENHYEVVFRDKWGSFSGWIVWGGEVVLLWGSFSWQIWRFLFFSAMFMFSILMWMHCEKVKSN